ncbi:hypothetical protein QRX60_49525 [Amycolatopsis mongoliensis]|uniref:Uncharacterized protein n=1 Tax=Amycolatopsis mongoliensis TaxID=715475 RepID=A0A9Y2JNN5_9PSEU|nr:hypothetical protein [Amycolatopsis sp. 4-36]WIY01961.1 hypothetical protein QRX60_49525 [Amycolatopsis sp. 4-36]
MDPVFGLAGIGAVIADDFDDLIEQRRTFATLRTEKLRLDGRTVRRVASAEKLLQPSRRRLVAERGPGQLGVKPSQDPLESFAWSGCPVMPTSGHHFRRAIIARTRFSRLFDQHRTGWNLLTHGLPVNSPAQIGRLAGTAGSPAAE